MRLKQLLFLLSLFAISAFAQPVEKTLKPMLATAGSWANFRKAQGSLRVETANLLQQAEKELQLLVEKSCPQGKIVFSTEPNKRLVAEPDEELCAELAEKTAKQPIQFSEKKFLSLKLFETWFSDFTQGKEIEGKELYQKCPGTCSPSYKSSIVPSGSGYSVTVQASCGLPRDRDDNQYILSATVSSDCQ